MSPAKHYQINAAEITAEAQDDEVLAINLNTGTYYVLEGTAAFVWNWLTSGVGVDDIIAALPNAAAITDFVDQLEQNRLIVPAENSTAAPPPTMETILDPPVLKIQTDAEQFVVAAPVNANSRVKAASADYASEAYPDEVVMLDLYRGLYYSLPEAAGIIWRGVEQAVTVREIVATLRQYYEGDWVTIENATIAFVDTLLQEGIVSVETVADAPASPFPIEDPPPEQKPPFKTPEMTRYDDMQNLLLLDPIHEVDEEIGWPQQMTPPDA